MAEDFTGHQIVRKNDLVFTPRDFDATPILSGVAPCDGCISNLYFVLFPYDKSKVYIPFYNYFMWGVKWGGDIWRKLSYGMRFSYNFQQFSMLPTVLPPLEEQSRIANFLDDKCGKIDRYIETQRAIIEKLKAYKQAVITEAVTKGLDPTVPMKDSGIEWIGEIPEGWEIIRLKFVMEQIIDCPHETPNYSLDGNYFVIRTADQDLGSLRPEQYMFRLDEKEYRNRIRRLSLDKDDIVYGREGERWGLACLIPESGKYCLGQRMMQFRCNKEILLPNFALWALNSEKIYLQGAVDTFGSTSPHVNISTMLNYVIPIPPLCEQKDISRRIMQKCSVIDRTLEQKQSLIDKLTEYKKSLIYEVVTGKREV